MRWPGVAAGFLALGATCLPVLGAQAPKYKPCGVDFAYPNKTDKTSAAPGETIKLYGKWGDSQGEKLVKLRHYQLEVVSWTATTLTVRLPSEIPAGDYGLMVNCNPINDARGGTFGTGVVMITVTGTGSAAASAPPVARRARPSLPVARNLDSRSTAWAFKVLIMILVFWRLIAWRMANPQGRFPCRADPGNPFVGFAGFPQSTAVAPAATPGTLVVHTTTASRAFWIPLMAILGPGVSIWLFLRPGQIAMAPAPVQLLAAFFSAAGWHTVVRQLWRATRFEISVGELRFFVRASASGPACYTLRKGEIKRFERSRHVAGDTTSREASSIHPYEVLTAVTTWDEKITLCAGDEAVFQPLLPELGKIAPVEWVAQPEKIAPSGVKYKEWTGTHRGVDYCVKSYGKRGSDPIVTVDAKLAAPLSRPLGINTGLMAPSAPDPSDSRASLVSELLGMGASVIDVGKLSQRLAVDFPLSRRVVDLATAQKTVELLIKLRDLSG